MNNWFKINQKLNLRRFLHSIFKQNCLMCAAATHELGICQNCINSLSPAPSPGCPQCGLPSQGEHCGSCLKSTPYYDATKALFSYTFPTNAILQHYKYNNALFLSQTFGELLSKNLQISDQNLNIDLIIPMPLHPGRIKERGFNQSLEIAKVIAKQHSIPIDSTSCSRIKNTPPQASLTPKERINNMKGAFNCTTHFSGQHIALIDDVMTTGTSLNALAKTLKQAGAEKISCYVIARTT